MILSILNTVANESSSNKKLAILKTHADNQTLKNVFRLAYNTRIVFGIKKIPEPFDMGEPMTLDAALEQLETQFATRKATGNTAIELLATILGDLSEDDQTVLERVIGRDLRIGASGETANKVWKKLIESQPVMLSESFKEKNINRIKYPAYAQLKSDGTRCMIIKHDGEVKAVSRNGREFTGITHILNEVRNAPYDNLVIDGELICVDESDEPLNRQTGNGIITKAQKGTMTLAESDIVRLQAWDVIDLEDYYNNSNKTVYSVRLHELEQLLDHHTRIIKIPTFLVDTKEEAFNVYNGYIDQGLEGIILKNTNHFWTDSRSKECVKFKVVLSFDAVIVDYYEHRKQEGKLGGFTVESACGKIRCNVGSGLKDTKGDSLDRTALWDRRESTIGQIVELECNGCITRKNIKDGDAPYSLFLPIIKEIREDKDVANTKDEVF